MTEGAATLPQGWTTGQLNDGRTFYINHASKTTAWEHPESAAPPPNHFDATTSVPAPANVYPMAGRAAYRSPQAVSLSGSSPQVQMGGCVRSLFWVSAGLGWVVWIFSVSSAGDQNWITDSSGGYGIGDTYSNYCDSFYANDSACAEYEVFMATQIIATVTCSVAVVIYTIAFFRPFEAQHGSAKHLGLVGGILTALATFFQMLAFIFAGKWVQEYVEELGEGIVERGPTYGVGVAAFVFGCLQATLVLLSFWAAGDGPLLSLVQQSVTPKEVDIPAQAFASQRKGTQPVANMPQVPQPDVSMGRGAIAANPPQLSHSNEAPPPYMFPDSGSYSSQPNNAKNRPPPSYHSADSGSTTV